MDASVTMKQRAGIDLRETVGTYCSTTEDGNEYMKIESSVYDTLITTTSTHNQEKQKQNIIERANTRQTRRVVILLALIGAFVIGCSIISGAIVYSILSPDIHRAQPSVDKNTSSINDELKNYIELEMHNKMENRNNELKSEVFEDISITKNKFNRELSSLKSQNDILRKANEDVKTKLEENYKELSKKVNSNEKSKYCSTV